MWEGHRLEGSVRMGINVRSQSLILILLTEFLKLGHTGPRGVPGRPRGDMHGLPLGASIPVEGSLGAASG